jgi:hypothetical protein
MATKTKTKTQEKAFGRIHVKRENGEPLILTFNNREAHEETLRQLHKEEFEVIDESFGYMLFETADHAMEIARFWKR